MESYYPIRPFTEKYGVDFDAVIREFGEKNCCRWDGELCFVKSQGDRFLEAMKCVRLAQYADTEKHTETETPAENEKKEIYILGFRALTKHKSAEFLEKNFEGFKEHSGAIYVSRKMTEQLMKMSVCDGYLESEREKFSDVLRSLEEFEGFGLLRYLEDDGDPGRRIQPEHKEILDFVSRHPESNITVIVDDPILHKSLMRAKKNRTARLYVQNIEKWISRPAFDKLMNQIKAPDNNTEPLVASVPAEGGVVYDAEGRTYTLGKSIGKGTEAFIYTTPEEPQKLVKIFHRKFNTELKIKKVTMFCERYHILTETKPSVACRIAFPERLVYNGDGKPVGYIMPYFEKVKELSCYTNRRILNGTIGVKDKFSQVRLAATLAEEIEYLHDHNIVFADLNLGNVLFDENMEAYLVDLDSAQLSDARYFYPTAMGRTEFLSPERLREPSADNIFDFLHRKEDDVWSLQILLYRILIGNDVFKSDKDAAAGNYIGQRSFNDRTADTSSMDYARLSYLPDYIISAFWNSFHRDGENFCAKPREGSKSCRFAAYQWRQKFRQYYGSLVYYREKRTGADQPIPEEPNPGSYGGLYGLKDGRFASLRFV